MNEPKIIEDSRAWMVVDKPAGLPTHATNRDEPDLLTLLGGALHAVHRLDRDTSGLLLIAKKKDVAAELMGLWGSENVGKFYRLVVHGTPDWSETQWDAPLSDGAEGRRDPAGAKKERKNCLTEVKLLEKADRRSLLDARLRTGRKHQIRRHAALAGFPVVGDDRYGKNDHAGRLGLHAYKLTLNWKGLKFEWISEPPPEFTALLAR